MTLILVHVAIIALITLICIKIKVWVPMLITLILSFTYFYWIISNSQPDGLSNIVSLFGLLFIQYYVADFGFSLIKYG